MEIITQIVQIASYVITISAAMALFVKPVREKIFNNKRATEGERCLLRTEMLRTYYKHYETKEIRQFEFENFIKLYEAYKALGGNSFIDEVHEEVMEWKIKS